MVSIERSPLSPPDRPAWENSVAKERAAFEEAPARAVLGYSHKCQGTPWPFAFCTTPCSLRQRVDAYEGSFLSARDSFPSFFSSQKNSPDRRPFFLHPGAVSSETFLDLMRLSPRLRILLPSN